MRSYTFNRPITGLIMLPLLFLLVMLLVGLSRDFSVMVLVLTIISLGLLIPILYLGFFRRLRLGAEKAEWRSPGTNWQLPLEEVRYFGTVKYRMFRFIFLSRENEAPFKDPSKAPVSSEDTFVIQFRDKAWDDLRTHLGKIQPHLKPIELKPR